MEPKPIHRHRIEATLHLQYPGLDTEMILKDIRIKLSKATGRIRSVMDQEGNLLFSLRPLDGHFIPSLAGAERILATGYRRNIVVMNNDAAPFVASGKTAFCKFVVYADEHIVPQSEVFLLDEQDTLLAIGTALHPAYAMLQLESGAAVRVRHSRE